MKNDARGENQDKGKGRINTSNLHLLDPKQLSKEDRAKARQLAMGGEGGLDLSTDSDPPASHLDKEVSSPIPENVTGDPPPTFVRTNQAISSSGAAGTGDLLLDLNQRRSSVAGPELPHDARQLGGPNSANVATSPKPIFDNVAAPAQPVPAADSRPTQPQFASQRTKGICCNIL